ncbi:pyruvate kinase [Campylobacter lari]|uniref:pyruvate kinase n=1 Tax=Campylobacter lari TaxID=201 RepID=UPI0012848202|nr:pyruvate kinase [Campylobacter lari]EAI2145562.1 pyruvate kinase [Campylobacter lari]EAI3897704.1 pyruvate kinase [Campylobacter lari]EAJ5697329.1 pyruvate kinase [Campylobacter lari]EAJ5698965.1 pyruvate kinase [Campylobacter lari]EAK9908213.1 pyruvate kinase [Campylobacter lari]
MQKYILTVGPSLGNKFKINEIHQDNFIYRINGAHGNLEDIKNTIFNIRNQNKSAKILIDLPGNKIRTANISEPIQVSKDQDFTLKTIQFNFKDFYKLIQPNMQVFANDSVFLFIVKSVSNKEIVFTSKSNGLLLNNKGMHIRNLHANIPFLFEKDIELIKLCNEFKIDYLGASFVRKAQDIKELKELLNSDTQIISKIETLEAVNNLYEILQEVEFILIDRGDLSTEVGIEKIPRFQNYIIQMANHNGIKVFLATQILKNMEEKPIPTIAEIDDLYHISKSGVYGIQLSEETAVGEYVHECIKILDLMKNEINSEKITL